MPTSSTPIFSLITFASYWGSKYGGINAFNADFLEAMAHTYKGHVDVICVVNDASEEDIEAAKTKKVTLVPLPYEPFNPHQSEAQATAAIEQMVKQNIKFDLKTTVWLGHDRITGQAALTAAKQAGGRSALIHHMSYDHYESFAENAATANDKRDQQETLFSDADILMAVGPVLRDALEDMVDEKANMIIPGLAAIEPKKKAPNTFSMFVSGRLSKDASKIKQGQLAVAAFANCYKQATQQGQPEAILNQPKLLMRGVDFDLTGQTDEHYSASEANLQKFAEGYADAIINLQPLPYTTDRQRLFKDLKSASVAAMPSWHEGFGLVGWEAIAAGVPLILSTRSGVYELIKQNHSGFEQSHLWAVAIGGKTDDPYFSDKDLATVSEAIRLIAQDPAQAREKAQRLKQELSGYTWEQCAKDVAGFFDWQINQEEPAAISEIPGYQMPKAAFDNNKGMAISVLLRSSEAVVPFDNLRQPALDKLLQWSTTSEYPITIRLMQGEGGLGKTRLATELCHQLKTQDWTVGLLDKDQTQPQLATLWQSIKATDKACLIVVDYAETQTAELIALFKLMLSQPSDKKVCLLLLARDGGEWWEHLASKDATTEALLTGRATSGPHTVTALYDSAEQRQQGYQNALTAFAEVLQRDAPTTTADLTGDHFAKPLFIQMSALLMLHGEQPQSADGITRAILNHEQRYWDGALNSAGITISGASARKLLALVTLAGSFATAKDAKDYWDIADNNDLSMAQFRQLFDCLAPLYPASQGLQAVKPDILGEALVAEMLMKPAGTTLLSAVLSQSASSTVKLNALTVLARLSLYKETLDSVIIAAFTQHLTGISHQLVKVAVETDSRLAKLAVIAIGQLKTNEQNAVAGQLVGLLPDDSVALNFLHCEIRRIIYEKEQKKFDKKPKAIKVQASFAAALYNYALLLSNIGNNDEACIKIEQAVDIRSQLAAQDSVQHEPDYAIALNNYSAFLDHTGQNSQALITTKKALDIRERLAQQNPDRHEPNYAGSLSNYAIYLSSAGQNDQALIAAKKVLDITERLAQQNPDRHEPDYADSLINYANRLSDAGQNDQALITAKKALDITERLAQQNPDRHEPDYALSLSNYAGFLSRTGQNDQALIIAKKALDIRERLAQQNPDRHEPDYATSLNNYANCLNDAGRYQQALEAGHQSIEITSRLYHKLPKKQAFNFAARQLFNGLTRWLIGDSPAANLTAIDDDLLQHLEDHQKPVIELLRLFVEALSNSETTEPTTAFTQILSLQQTMSQAQKHQTEGEYHCAAAWLNHKGAADEQTAKWLELSPKQWQKFKQQRQGNVPVWMLDVAKKLINPIAPHQKA